MGNAEQSKTRRTMSVSAGNDPILPDAQAHHIMAPAGFRLCQIVRYLRTRGDGGDREGLVARGSEDNWVGMLRNGKFRELGSMRMTGKRGKKNLEGAGRSVGRESVYTSQYPVAGLPAFARGTRIGPSSRFMMES